MKTTLHRPWRKALSLVLTVLMVGGYVGLFSGVIGNDLFGTKQAAQALGITSQSSGSYTFKVTFNISKNGTHDHNSGWGQTTEDTFIIAARTAKDNWRASYGYTYDYWGSTGSKTWEGGGKQAYDGGFPDGFYMMGNDNSVVQGVKADITKIEISGKTVWTGTMHVDSTTNEYHTYVYSPGRGTDGGNDSSYGYTKTTTKDWPLPAPSCTFHGPTTIYTDGSATATYGLDTVKDQYGVNWGFTGVSWSSSHSAASINSSGVATFGYNNGTPYDVTFTPTLKHSSYGDKTSGNGYTVHVVPCETLSLNTAKTVKQSDNKYFYFTPSSTGDYIFFTYDNDNTPDPYLHVYESSNGVIGTDIGSNDDVGDAKIRELLSGSQNNMGNYQSYLKLTLTAGVKYLVHDSRASSGETYPLKVCKAVDITFNATGGATTFYKTLPAGHTLHMDQSGLTRDGHSLIAWSTTSTGAEAKSCMASETITIPSSETTYYALWNPSNAPALSAAGGDYTAAIDQGSEIEFYQFTPSETRKYLIYGKASFDSFVLRYNANTYGSNGTYIDYQDDASSSSNGNLTGYTFTGNSGNQFFMLRELEKNTKYLFGVKAYYDNATGSLPFRFEPVYKVEYKDNGGSGSPAAQDKFIDKNLTLSAAEPARSGYTFDGWGTSASDKTVDYAPSGTYSSNADLTLYAIWSRPITNTYHYYNADLAEQTVEKSNTAYNAETSIDIDTPASSEVAEEIVKNDKTWTLKGWSANTVSGDVWGGATQTASVGIGGNTAVSVSTATAYDYYPVYALKSTTFYANFKYYADEATAYTDVKMSGTAVGDAATGAMTVAPVTEDGANSTVPRYYTKDGVVWELQGWSQTESALGTGTATIAYNDETVTLNVPGAGVPTSTLNQTQIIPLYPVYKKYATAIHAHFNYYTAADASTFLDVSGRAVGESATAGDVKFPDASLVNTSYTKDGVTYTLVGWSDVNNSDVNSEDCFRPFNTTITLDVLAHPATDYYTFYPVYEYTTTARYYTYTSAGAQTSLTKSNTLLKTDSFTPAAADVEVPLTGFNKTVTLDGRTFTFCGWRADTVTDAAPTVASDVSSENHAVRDAEYTYYAVYTNDALALSYDTAHDGVTAAPAPATQNKTQYISVATGSADINNVAELTFDINPDNVIPEKTGYTFIGWGDEDSEDETADYAKTGATLQTRIDKSLFARFSVNNQNVTFVYYDGASLEGDYRRETKQVSYDDELRDDTNSNARYVVTAPTVKVSARDEQGNPIINLGSIVHANDKYHYVFKEWVRSDASQGKGIYTVTESGNDYTATFKNVQEDITIQAVYDAYVHHYEQLTTAQLSENGVTADATAFKEATCTADGYQYMKCVDCGHVYKQILPKIDHKDANGNLVVTYSGYKAAACTATGKYATAACALCGNVVKKADNTSTQYYDIVDGLFVPVDSADGIIPAKGHDYQFGSAVVPTCTEKGYDLYVCANNETHTEKRNFTDALGHDPQTQAGTPATCTTEGRADKTVCRRCNLIISDSYVIPALGHEMERTAAVDATCTGTGNIGYYTCRNCEKVFADKDGVNEITLAETVTAALGHDWVETAAEEATCTKDGHTAGIVCSRCGEIAEGSSAVTTQEALGHDWDGGVHTDSDQPCVTPGYTTYTCQRCHETETEYDELTDHVEKTVAEQPATCTEKGKSSYKVCDVCGKTLTNFKWLPMKAHTYTQTVTAEVPATCTAAGTSAVMKCANCDTTVGGDEIPALEHSYSNWIVTVASCEEDGVRTKYCKRCGDTLSETLPAAGHTEKTVEAVAATCSAEGKTAGTVCEVCGQVLDGCEVVPMTAHQMGEAQTEREATCAQAGLEYTECAVCGHKEYTTIEKPAHTETVTKEAVAATCTATGLKAEITCSACGTVLQAQTSVPKLDHVWQTMPAVAPTCTEKGKTTYEKCVNCGLLLTEARDVPALGHQWGEWQLVKAATCLEDGSRVRYCALENCEAHTAVISDVQVKKLDKLGHNMTKVAAKAPTCGVAGNPEYYVCSRCTGIYYADTAGAGKYTADEIVLPALVHVWTETSVTAPTCTEKGFTTFTCSNCGNTKTENEVAANGHQGGMATCLAQALCEVCGEPYGSLAEHQYVTVSDEGDCQHHGSIVRTCSVCGDEVTTELPLGPHQTEFVILSEPTCTAAGSYQYVCTVCGETTEQGSLEALGHHDENGDGKCDACGQSMNGSTDDSGNGTTTGVCDKCGRNHVGKTGGFWGYDGFICKLISFFRSIVRLFSK